MPYGLAFQRYYDSGTRLRNGPLGLGWTHSFALTAAASSDAFEGMAANSPINGAVAIAATFVTLDILNDGVTTAKPLDRMVIASVVQRWLMDLLTNNVVAVTQPGYVEHFTKLADGTYNPPPGSAATLALSSGAYTYTAKDRTTLSFDTAGNLSTWVNPAGTTISLAYSGSPSKLASVTNSLGRSLTLTYTSDQLTQVADNAGRSVIYAYDSAGNLTSFIDPLGHATTYAYALPGQLTQVFYPSQPTLPFVTNTYDSLGRVRTQANANGVTWQYFFAGTRGEEDDALGTQNVIYTTSRGRTRLDIKDLQGLNRVTTTAFDGLDRVVLTTLPEGNSLGYTYDTKSNVLTVTATPKPGSPLSPSTTSFLYDPTFNKPTNVTGPPTTANPAGLVTTMTYDPSTGNLLSMIADAGSAPHINAQTRYTYNGLGLLASATDPLGTLTQFFYDSAGNRLSTIADAGPGRLNQTTAYTYNARGDVVSVTDPRGNTAATTYDDARRLVTTTAPTPTGTPNGVVTTNSYDAHGRLLQVQQAADGIVLRTASTTYTPTGKQATTTDTNSNVTRFAYDALDRRVRITDAMGRVTQFTYTALSQPFQTFNTTIQATALVRQTYTADGLPASLTDANGNTTSFAYDGFDRLATTTYPGGSTETFTYDAADKLLTRKTRANGTISFTYDTLNRLKTKAPPASAPVVTYSYDLNNRQIGVSDTSSAIAAAVPPGGATVAFSTSYTYDALNRPTGISWNPVQAAATPSAGPVVTFGHSYNAVNQRVGETVSDNSWLTYPPGTSTTNYTANALNQYTAVGGTSPTYDGNGNLTSDGTYTLGYDAENRLISASGGGNTAAYAFDGRGWRKTKTVNGTTTISVTDADNREVLEYDGSSGAVLRWYAYGLGPNTVLNQMNVPADTRAILLPDLLGSIVASFDSSSGTLTKFGYQPYGTSAAAANPFGYTGQRIDPETGGLYFYRARHYSTAFGRFLQPDPIGYNAGINLYAYVRNDPLNLTDPLGLCDNPQGCGSSGGLLGFLAPAGVAARSVAVGAAIAAGTAVAAAAAAAAVLLYPSSTASNDTCDPPNCGNQYVVRAGAAAPNSLEAGTEQTINGYGFSVQTAPGLTPEQLAGGAPRIEGYRQYSVTTTNQLQSIPGVSVNSPTPGGGANHGTVNIPYPAPPGIFPTISGQFQQRPNPFFKPN